MTHMMINDTFGDITAEEHAELRKNARMCSICGMYATIDPAFHAFRYDHAPRYWQAGVLFEWSVSRHEWAEIARRAPACDCFAPGGGRHADWCATVNRDLVPGYTTSADGQADAADQRKADAR